ncbi:PLP-dependent aminotransferase family protein [Rapidithrix thailandica]|uniref:PLP-dependent aminotransferase family protein n=1 Tax=Rapidithrix thailandica TaxID=413964 RepID=A0AAW9S3U8_9BACT
MLRPWDLQIELTYHSEKAVYLQIADAIIDAIQEGKLKSGDALPGSRRLAGLLTVNRNTVVEALDVLLTEGWLISKERKGTFVAKNLPKVEKHTAQHFKQQVTEKVNTTPRIVFDDGVPDSKLAPMNELARAYRQLFNQKARWRLMGYSDPLGDIGFREAIAKMLNFKRGMHVSTGQICITRGSQMAMYLAAQNLLAKGDKVIIENPGYKPAWQTLEKAGAQLLPVNVDAEGICLEEVETLIKTQGPVKAVFLTPHHQFPTTVSLSLSRRLHLIDLSNKHGFTLIEDDYDHEFHFGQRPLLPLSSYKETGNYIYIGSMSKVVAPALRIGYLVSNEAFIKSAGSLRKLIDVQGDNIMEQAVLQLIQDGEIRRHLKRASGIYKDKKDFFETLLKHYLGEKVRFTPPEGGLAYWLEPLHPESLKSIHEKLLEKNIKIMSPEHFSFAQPVNGLRLGYASPTKEELECGVQALAKLL